MSRICKLSITGIRNFDDEGEAPVIKFSRPLTLILGPNGTGKTTIIECLRYVLSGEFPPGSDSGKAFIHDPILKKTPSVQVLGKVMAEIVDCRGLRWTISRTLEATRARDKLTLKTKDSTITIVDKKNKGKAAYNTRCGDVNVEAMTAMGVSKAILNYVLFCHQDDSNWPFETGKNLKERFDAIFETTRYNKALDCVRKLMNEKKTESKGLIAERRGLLIVVDEVKSKQKKLAEFETRKAETQEKIDEIRNQLKPIIERLAYIKEVEAECCKWHLDAEKKKMEHKHATEQIAALRADIKEFYEGSTAELENEIASYDEILGGKNKEIVKLERELEESSEKEKKISALIAERRVTVGTLKQQIHDHTVKVASRNDTLKEMLDAWDLNESIAADPTEKDANELIEKFEQRLRQLEHKIQEKTAEQDREQDRLQRKVNNLRAERSTTESQLANNKSELENIKVDIRTNQDLLTQSSAKERQLSEVDSKLDKANKKVDGLNKTHNIDGLKRQISETIAKEEDLDREYNRIDKEIAQLREQSTIYVKLESCQRELADKEKELQSLRDKHGDSLRMLLGQKNFPEEDMKTTMNQVQEILNKRIQSVKKQIETIQCETTTYETSAKHKKQEFEKKAQEIEADREKVSVHCKDYKNYSDIVLLHSTKLKELESKRGMLAYQEVAYKEYIKKLTEPDPSCPLCHRGFNCSKDAMNLVKELRTDMSGLPNRLRDYEKNLSAQRKAYDALLQLRPVVDKIEDFENSQSEEMRSEVEEAEQGFQASQQKLNRHKSSLAEPEKKLSICKDMVGDMALWDRCTEEVELMNVTVIELQDQLENAGFTTDRTLQEVEAEQNQLHQNLKETRNEIKRLQSMLDSRNEEIRQCSETRTKLLEEQLRIHKDMQDIKQAKETLEILRTKEKEVTETIRKRVTSLSEAGKLLDVAVQNLERDKQVARLKQESDRKVIREHSKDLDKLNSIQAEVNTFVSRDIEGQLRKVEEKLESAERTALKFKNERTAREAKVSKMKEDIRFHDTAKRDLMDNRTLRRRETEAENLKKLRDELNEKLRGTDFTTLSKERKNLCERRDHMERERNKAIGNEEELAKNVADLTLELQRTEYRSARKNYREKCAELTVNDLCVKDLLNYSKVLDAAMIEYHEERMSTVNKIMKRLWDLIYTGTDTTSIQIRTDATDTKLDKRRQFNYKLVQIKHGAEMDMKGRCSAGQKVLASIILRLALAETFCEKCGVLALDEPTTNLDEDNSKSLADALHKYVSLRKLQRNFQLIVITHDENFIPQLGQLSSNNSYYELYRYPDGLSGIKSVSLDGLATRNPDDSTDDEGKDNEVPTSSKRLRAPSAGRAQPADKRPRKKHTFE